MRVTRLSEAGGVSVENVNLSRPTPPALAATLRRLFDDEGLVVVRGQNLTMAQLVTATDPFGGVEQKPVVDNNDQSTPGVSVLSSRGANGNVMPDDPDAVIGYVDWHTDEAYLLTPNRGKLLYAVTIPAEGGTTGFIDGNKTYAGLSETLKTRIAGLHVVQSWRHAHEAIQRNRGLFTRGATELADDRFPDVAYPLVLIHPVTGGKSLNLPPLWASRILELADDEGWALFEELRAHILQPKFAYWHSYLPGDLVAWDNWRFLHAASGTPGRHVRTMWRTVIRGGPTIGHAIEPRVSDLAQ